MVQGAIMSDDKKHSLSFQTQLIWNLTKFFMLELNMTWGPKKHLILSNGINRCGILTISTPASEIMMFY